MNNDDFMANKQYSELDIHASIVQKNNVLNEMQKLHQNATGEIVNTVFSTNPGIRDELVKKTEKYPITMIDFADIPDSVPDVSLLRIIANMLDRSYEKEVNAIVERTNRFVLIDKKDSITVSPEMLRLLESKVSKAIDKLVKRSAVKVEDVNKIKELFLCDNENDITFRNQRQLLDFLRKIPIKESGLKQHTKTKYILIICAVLKEMLRETDFKAQRHYIHAVREQLEKFIRVELVSMLEWEGTSDDPIQDLSNTEYFSDKVFLFRRKLLNDNGVNYPRDIRVKLSYRSKQDRSIQDKLIIEPTVKTVDVLHDLGGIKYVVVGDEQNKKTAILLYIMFLQYAKKEQKFNGDNSISPANAENNAFLPGGKYFSDKVVIERFLNNMSVTGSYRDSKAPLFKDSGLLLLDPKSQEGDRKLDENLYDELGIVDVRYRHLLHMAVEKKNKAFRDKKAEAARKLDEAKMQLFEQHVCKPEHKKYSEWIWFLIKRYDDIKKRISKFEQSNQHAKIINDKSTDERVSSNSERIHYELLADGWKLLNKKEPGCECVLSQLDEYYKDWRKQWDHHKDIFKQNKAGVKSGIKGDWKVTKISANVRQGHLDDQRISIEHQILGHDELKNLATIDEHVIYNPAKQLAVYGRNNSGIVSLADIEHIVDTEILPQFKKYPDKLGEKGLTFEQIKDEIVADPLLLPVGGTFRDKLIYNFIHERGLKKKGNVYLTPYFYNLSHYNLTPEIPQG